MRRALLHPVWLVAMVVASAPARAESITVIHGGHCACTDGDLPKTEWSLLGTRFMIGVIPVDGAWMSTAGIGVSIDRIVFGNKLRVLAEYEFAWIGESNREELVEDGAAALRDGGHRVHLGLRRRLTEKSWANDEFWLWLDGEVGGGAMLVDRHMDGAIALPHAFVGVRGGLALQSGETGREQRWEYEVLIRGLALPDGVGVVGGLGLVWGD